MDSPYGTVRELTIEPGCPWYEAQQTFGAPNVNWCEPTTCSIINEPINTWSNMGLVIVGLIVFFKFKDRLPKQFGLAVFVMGVLSFIYHASNNFLTQYIDFVGMFTVMSFLAAVTTVRFFSIRENLFYSWYWFFFSAHAVLFMIFHITKIPVQFIMYINLIPIIILELYISFQHKIGSKQKFFFVGVGLTILAQIVAVLDIKRIYCNPEGWIHGHALWHLIGAVAAYFLALHVSESFKMKN